MPAIYVNNLVRLTRDVPLNGLHRGDVGVVQSLWFAPDEVYEVEFRVPGHDYAIRTVLHEGEFVVERDHVSVGEDDLVGACCRG